VQVAEWEEIRKGTLRASPAMAANATDRLWTLPDLKVQVQAVEEKSETPVARVFQEFFSCAVSTFPNNRF
jgi:hypothetical protein